jgi:hypothetical protein
VMVMDYGLWDGLWMGTGTYNERHGFGMVDYHDHE